MYLTDKIWEIFYFLPNITDFVVRGSAIEGSVGVRDVFGGKGGRGGRLRTLDLSLSLVGDHFLEEVFFFFFLLSYPQKKLKIISLGSSPPLSRILRP